MSEKPVLNVVPQDEVISRLQHQLEQSYAELEELMPQLGHSEVKRLHLATARYPHEVKDFSKEPEAMIRAYSANKRISDVLVALGVETVIKEMLANSNKEETTTNE